MQIFSVEVNKILLGLHIPVVTDTPVYSGDWAELGEVVGSTSIECTDLAGE